MRWRISKPGGQGPDEPGSPSRRPRPKRFAIAIPVRYRRNGDDHWHKGTTENLSCNGILLRASRNLNADFPLTLRFVLPADLAGQVAVQVQCEGHVVREERLQKDISVFGVALSKIKLLGEGSEPEPTSEELAESWRQPLAAFVHRLSSDLSIIVGKCELMISRGLDASTAKEVEEIKRAALHAAEYARQLI